jgi:uncharacterized protein YaeQ
MASNATIFKAALQISDMDRQYYEDSAVTLARHPSETDERMMVRLLAFVLHAAEGLSFGRGLSTEEEPGLSLTHAAQHAIAMHHSRATSLDDRWEQECAHCIDQIERRFSSIIRMPGGRERFVWFIWSVSFI